MNRLAIVALVSLLMLLAGCSSKQQSATNSSPGSTTSNPPAATKSTNPATTQPQGSTNPASGGTTNNPSATPPSGNSATTPATNPIATVETSMGTFKIRLYLDQAPVTAGNFVKLVNQHFYDGLIFHRVVPGFVIQAGDPFCSSKDPTEQQRCGQGGPGWTIPREIAPGLKHDRAGMVAMARSSDPDSAGSQFYITLAPTPSLDGPPYGPYAVFGQVIDGLDVVLAMGKVATDDNEHPVQPVVIKKITLEGN